MCRAVFSPPVWQPNARQTVSLVDTRIYWHSFDGHCGNEFPSTGGLRLQDDPEPRLVRHHPVVRFLGVFERVGLDFGRHVAERAELQGVL